MITSRPFTPTEQELDAILTGKQSQFCRPVRLPGYPDRVHEFHNPRIIKPGVVEFNWNQLAFSGTFVKCPYGIPGDSLWVKERWRPVRHRTRTTETYIRYCFDEQLRAIRHNLKMDVPTRWRPAVTMPKWASRHSLNVLKVGIERVAYTWTWVVDFEVIK